jgi:hypothetical protein
MWHAATQKLLNTGHVARYVGDALMPDPRPRQAAYAVYDADARLWSPWDTLDLPDDDWYFAAGAGAGQRVDLPSGEILLPICHHAVTDDSWQTCYFATIARCVFDGRKLTFVEAGNHLTVDDPRGFCEPSLTYFEGRYYMTLRNDVRGYVTSGDDGLHFDEAIPWRFDNGEELGNYNTQQHWVVHSDALYLVYTRRGLNNDHVMRHRAPLVMAQVDPGRLCVIRETERILVPERGARLGNFAMTTVNENESWVIVAEWMQPAGCEQYGSDNSVYAARIQWHTPNRINADAPRPS